MSQESVRREIAAKRTYAAQLEQRANDKNHTFTDPAHRKHMLDEAARLWAEADREETALAARAAKQH